MGTHPIFESDFDCLTEAMKRPGLKAGSKRQNIRLREKIKKKVAEHKRKERRDAKKSPGQGKTKKQHVPNSAPFKDEVMSEAIAHEERKNAVKTAYGADELTAVLGGYSRRRGIKTGVTAAVVGFPNVGKSSVINSLARSRVCTTNATAGSTKDSSQLAIDKAVKLLDSPGVLFGGSAEKQAMRGALSASALADPIDGALALMERCDLVQLALHYNSKPTSNTRAFLAQLAEKRGMVRKGGIPDLEASARQILQDCQRGKIRFFTKAPKVETHKIPKFLDVTLVKQLADEFQLDATSDWMATTELPQQPSQGQTIKISDDGYTELDTLVESDAEVEDEGKMEQEDDMEVEAPATKKVRFEPTQKKTVDASDLRKVQKVAKDKMKRKDKFETKLSANFEKALGNL